MKRWYISVSYTVSCNLPFDDHSRLFHARISRKEAMMIGSRALAAAAGNETTATLKSAITVYCLDFAIKLTEFTSWGFVKYTNLAKHKALIDVRCKNRTFVYCVHCNASLFYVQIFFFLFWENSCGFWNWGVSLNLLYFIYTILCRVLTLKIPTGGSSQGLTCIKCLMTN